MPWCPLCKMEYVDGIQQCSDCGEYLVDRLPEEPVQESPGYEPLVLLTTVGDDFMAMQIDGMLRQAQIPVIRRSAGPHRSIAGSMTSLYGASFYVPERLIAQAKELVEGLLLPGEPDGEADVLWEDGEADVVWEQNDSGRWEQKNQKMILRAVAVLLVAVLLLLVRWRLSR